MSSGTIGIIRNEEADKLAKKETHVYPTGPEPVLNISRSRIVADMYELLFKRFNMSRRETPEMRQATLHMNGNSSCQTSAILSINQRGLREVTGLLTLL